MSTYQLEQTGQQVQNILNEAPQTKLDLQSEIERATGKEGELTQAIADEKTRAEGIEGGLRTDLDAEIQRATDKDVVLENAIGAEETRAEGVEGALRDDVDAIDAVIPNQASSSNQLADKAFVNSSIATNTADFKGTYNSLEQLETEVTDANANDYAFVIGTDQTGNTVYNRYKYVEGTGWEFEYALNNSSFTASQWAAINSAITAALVAKLTGLPTAEALTTSLNDLLTAIGAEKTRAELIEAGLRTDVNANAGAIVTEKNRAEGIEGTLTNGLTGEIQNRSNADTALGLRIDGEATLRENADTALQGNIDAINAKIPTQASSSNQLADKAFVNSSIATNTAEFKGTYNSLAELEAVTGANANDYGFVISTDETGNTVYNRYKYVAGSGWTFEYALNNSSFTASQWAAINSEITAALVAKLAGLPTIDGLNAMFAQITDLIPSEASSANKLIDAAQFIAALATKQAVLTFDSKPTQNSQNPVTSGGLYNMNVELVNAIVALQQGKQDALEFDDIPAPGSNNPVKSGGIFTMINNEVERAIAAERGLQTEYDDLFALYQTLEGGDIVPVPYGSWPVSPLQQRVIYRVANAANPTGYSDYMYNGSTTILLATFTFPGIDAKPTASSNNLAYSGGIFDSILQNGPAFDLSAYNAVGGTLATYADLNAALTALNALPAAYKKGGMSMKFVQTYDNKYVQYVFIGTSTAVANFKNTDNWQKVNLEKELYQLEQKVFLQKPELELGTLSGTDGSESVSDVRCRTEYIKVVQPITVSCNKPYLVFHFTTNNTPFDEKSSSFVSGDTSYTYTAGYIRIVVDITNSSISAVNLELFTDNNIEKQIEEIEQGVSKELSQTNLIQQNLWQIISSYHEKKYPISKNVTVVSLADNETTDTIILDATKIESIKISNAITARNNVGIVLTDDSNNILSRISGYATLNATELTGVSYIYVTTRNKANASLSELSLVVNGVFLTTRDISEYIINLNDNFNIRYVEDGGLSGADGSETTAANRCRTKFIKVNGFFGVLSIVPCMIYLYDEIKQFISHTDWSSEPYTATHQGYVRVSCDITGKTKDDANVIVATNTVYWDVLLKAQKVERIDNELGYDSLNPTEEGKYINLSGGVGTTAPVSSPTTGPNWQYYLTSISQGDIVRITGTGGESGAKLWAFLDANNVILSVAEPNAVEYNKVIVAPQNAAKVVVNTLRAYASSVGVSTKGSLSFEIINNAQKLPIDTSVIVGSHSTNFSFWVTGTKVASQLIVTSKYTGNTPIFKIRAIRNNYTAISLYQVQVGKSYDYDTNIIYLPPVFDGFMGIEIVVEIGTTLDIKEINVVEGCIKDNSSPIVMHAHLGFFALETANSFIGFEMAGRSGFGACICNPNDDGDGEIWCYHNGNSTIIYNDVKDSYNLKEYTTAQVQTMTQYNIGYTGYPLPTFDDFCRICATYGMKPTLSMGSLTSSLYGKLKHTLTKYGLLEKTTLKDGGLDAEGITNAINSLLGLYSVFGDSVTYELYGEVCNTSVVDEFYSANFGNARKVIEPYASSIDALSSSAQKEWCDYVISKGIVLSLIAGSDSTLDFEGCLKLGFIEFTTDTLPKMFY